MQKVNKNVKECGIYVVIKIHNIIVYENVDGRVVPSSGTVINCNCLTGKFFD